MAGFPEGAREPWDQVGASLRQFADRLRRLEAARFDPPLTVLPATAPSTSGTADTPLFRVLAPGNPGAVVSVTLLPTLTGGVGAATLRLRNGDGWEVDEGQSVTSGAPVTLTAVDASAGPFTVTGQVDAGAMTVQMLAASAPRWTVDGDDSVD